MFTIEAIIFFLEYLFWLERANLLQVKHFHFESEKSQKKKKRKKDSGRTTKLRYNTGWHGNHII